MSLLPLNIRIGGRGLCFLLCVVALTAVATWFGIRKTAASRVLPPVAPAADANTIAHNYGELPLSFVRNEGQTDPRARFISRGPGYDLFLTNTCAVLSLRRFDSRSTALTETSPQLLSVMNLKMIGAAPDAVIEGQEELPGKINYFVGNDRAAWRTNVPTFRKVKYAGVFPGVDLVYYGNRTQLEYDFILAPHAKVAAIKFSIEGADRISIGAEGDLHLATRRGEVTLRKPEIYQVSESGGREQVDGGYVVRGNEIGFKLNSFDSGKALVIDPVLSYSTLLGSGGGEQGNSITIDAQGNAYVAGVTSGGIFPTTAGAFQTTGPFGGAFVSKLDPTGSSLIYSTYLSGVSGNGSTNATGVAVDGAGNAYVSGYTSSADFPTMNPLRGGRNNLLITSDSGSAWGPSNVGTANRAIQTLAIDKNSPSTIYAGTGLNGGIFKSTDTGASWTALNTGLVNAQCTALVIDPTSSSTIYAALIAQNSGTGVYKSVDAGSTWTLASSGLTNQVASLAIDPQNHLTLYAGTTFGVFKTTNGGTSWASSNTGINFGISVVVIDPTTPTTIYAASNGGGVFKTTNAAANWAQVNNGLTNTFVRALVIDPAATSTLYAGTGSGGVFKTTNAAGSWSPSNSGPLSSNANIASLVIVPTSTSTIFAGTSDGRILKTTDAGVSWNVVYTTTTNTSIRALAIDSSFPARVIAGVDTTTQSLISNDAFVTKFNPSGSALVYSTFVGGLGDDQANGITVDGSGNAYLAGMTASSDYPAVNAAQATFGGGSGQNCGDAFITKLNAAGSAISFSTFLGGAGCDLARAVALDGAGNAYLTGSIASSNLATPGAFQTTMGASGDAFAARYTTSGGLGYFTYLGGEGTDTGAGIAADNSGNAYITGLTTSISFPTANPIQATNGGSAGDAFVTKLNSTGSALVYSTFLGGSDIDGARGIAIDSAGNAYVAGFTNSAEFPLTPGALRTKSPFFKTIDGGAHWSNDNYGLKTSIITAFGINPVTAATVFAGTRNSVYRSTDAGRNWALSMNGLVTPNVTSFAVNPVNPSIVYLSSNPAGFSGSSIGVFKSTDGGSSWTAANNGIGNGGIVYVVIDPLTPSTLYAGAGSILFKSTDSGGTWTKIGPPILSSTALIIDPQTPTTLYSTDNGSGGKVSKSTDGGVNWQTLSNSPGGSTLAIDPVTPATLYAAGFGSGLFKTTDGGATWTFLNTLSGFMAIDPLSPATIYLGGNSGISKSTNGGATFSAVNNGLTTSFISSLAINPANSSVYAGANAFTPEEVAFVSKISTSGTLMYSTLLGGQKAAGNSSPQNDEAYSIAVDAGGNAYVTGNTLSVDFPVTANSYQPFNRGGGDAFVAKLTTSYLIGGRVLDSSNAAMSGVPVTLSDGTSLTTVVTEGDGSYQFSRLREGGNFTVSAARPHFTMAPPSQTFNNLSSDQTLNFVATATNAPFYNVSGQINGNGTPLTGVTVTLSGSQQGFTTTDSNGAYSFTLAGGGNYIVTPSTLGFALSPPNQTFNNLSADQTANFTGTRQNFVVTTANDHGPGSLRQAILDANATQGLDTITFNIPGSGIQTINLLVGLPAVTDPVVIDAATQPGYAGTPLIEVNGSLISNSSGFQVSAGGSTIRGFIINRFTAPGGGGITLTTNGGNTIQGNFIGLDSTGNAGARNNNGITITIGSTNNLIGGTTAAARNVISGSSIDGIAVGSTGTQIQGNFIGTNSAGSAPIPNGINGINISGSPQFTNNVVGGTAPGAGNVISGNPTGIFLLAPGNIIQGNLIGTDVTGLKAVPNNTGINAGVANTTVGGVAPGARNVISGNNGNGVSIGGAGCLLQGNLIGTDITGTVALGNGGDGAGAGGGALVGGLVAAARNIISGNGGTSGFANLTLGTGAIVQGNYIGTDITGNIALTNFRTGIEINGSSNNIGGTTVAARNVISGNTVGIEIGGSTTGSVAANVVQGNYIGVGQDGASPLPNSFDGIRLNALNVPPVGNNTIGGTAAGAGNVISFNGGAGVMVFSGTGNSIRGNSIVSNGGLGIDLAPTGLTANDQGDGDTGANNRQNFPVLTSLTPANSPNTIAGNLNSTPSTAFTIDFYANLACDPSGNGEGAQFLASTTVTTGADGNAAINFALGSSLPAGTIVTATATDPAGNTSEFSPCVSGAIISIGQANYSVTESQGSVSISVNRTGDTALPVAVDYATSDAGASAVPCSTPNGKASAKCDFIDGFGTLRFAAGETSKTIAVLITQDNYLEGPETFTLALSNVGSGAMLTSPSTTTITINDEATEPPGNAIDDAATFVRQHYHDFLNREPDQSGLDFWTGEITGCGGDTACTEVKRINVSGAFFLSIEFQQTGYLVERMYKVAYGNATGISKLGGTSHQLSVPRVRYAEFIKDTQRIGQGVVVLAPGWEQTLENNKQAYALEFVSTTRFLTAYPISMTPAQFVDLLNVGAGNVVSSSERTTAINLFGGANNTGNITARAQALRQVAEDPDLFTAESNRAFVLAQYFGYMRRNPNDPQDNDYTGYEFWLNKLNEFNGNYIAAEMVKAFISSSEYRQRFGP